MREAHASVRLLPGSVEEKLCSFDSRALRVLIETNTGKEVLSVISAVYVDGIQSQASFLERMILIPVYVELPTQLYFNHISKMIE